MRRFAGILSATVVLAGCGAVVPSLGSQPAEAPVTGQAIAGEQVVQVKPGTRFVAPVGAKVVDTLELGDLGGFLLVKAEGPAMLASIKSVKGVVNVEPNRRVQLEVPAYKARALGLFRGALSVDDPLFAQQWYVNRIGAQKAWSRTQGEGVVVAVVDTGVDHGHPDLAANIVSKGYSFVNNRADGIDEQGHGTHVAGTIAAVQNNAEGVTGVAPKARILPVQVLAATGGGSLYQIAKGVKYAADYGVQNKVHVVVNMSLGGAATVDGVSYTTGWYATRKGALLVAAAGNSNTAVGTPARWDKYYMAVSAISEKDEKANFSNYGPEISVGAPGTNIVATTPTYDVPLNKFGYPKFYAPLQGTSMACPVVAATCALTWSVHLDWDWKKVRTHVQQTSLDLGPKGHDVVFGHGLVQADAALGVR
jgi:subtilisin family serine protease